MRQIKQNTQKKPKNSKFFDYFLNQYGETCTLRAGDKEIHDKMKMFFIDLAFGNIIQPKYLPYLAGDARIVNYAISIAQTKMCDNICYRDSLQYIAMNSNPMVNHIKMNPNFDSCLRESTEKVMAYGIIFEGLKNYVNSGIMQDGLYHYEMCNPDLLVAISSKFVSTQFTKLTKRMLFE